MPTSRRRSISPNVPAGGVLAALLALLASDGGDWRSLFLFGAAPLVVLLPVALWRLPESPKWLQARGHIAQARQVSERTGVPLPEAVPDQSVTQAKVGFPALATRRYALATLLLGLTSCSALLLTYAPNTWLPEIMGQSGYGKSFSLVFLLTLNGGAILGGLIASRVADRLGPQRVIATTFVLAAIALSLLTLGLPFGVLLFLVAIAGVGTIGTQVLIYGFVSHYYDTVARAAGVAWCAGFGRLGGIGGPIVGAALIGAGLPPARAFYVFAAVAVLGMLVTFLVPRPAAEPTTARHPRSLPQTRLLPHHPPTTRPTVLAVVNGSRRECRVSVSRELMAGKLSCLREGSGIPAQPPPGVRCLNV